MKTAGLFGTLTAALLAGSPLSAQEAATAQPVSAPETPMAQGTSWYVMISLYESVTENSCGDRLFKVTTSEPIVVQGPDQITSLHINAVVNAWRAHLQDFSPQAWRLIKGDTGQHLTDVYFRRSEDDVRKAFRRDGHATRDPGCWGSVLIKSPVDNFEFAPHASFLSTEFGQEPPPPPGAAGVARELPKIPGLAARN